MTYEGKPCRYCGGTTRRVNGRHCVNDCASKAYRATENGRLKTNEANRRSYERMPNLTYAALLLKQRRRKALERIEDRNRRETTVG